MTMTMLFFSLVGLLAALLLLGIWSACILAGRADRAIDRYLQQEKAKAHANGCATRTPAARPQPEDPA